jgi:hypothetical protein
MNTVVINFQDIENLLKFNHIFVVKKSFFASFQYIRFLTKVLLQFINT